MTLLRPAGIGQSKRVGGIPPGQFLNVAEGDAIDGPTIRSSDVPDVGDIRADERVRATPAVDGRP